MSQLYTKMDFKAVIEPLLKKHKLVAFLVNDGWLLIRRKEYIDIYIQKQPFSSVEFLFHIATKRIVVRVWGRTVIHEQDGDLTKELERAFSTKPCFGNVEYPSHDTTVLESDITFLELPARRVISKNCLVWSEDEYLAIENGPAICQPCKSALSSIKNTYHSDPFVTEQKVTIKGDINFSPNDENQIHYEEELSQTISFLGGDDCPYSPVIKEDNSIDEKPLLTGGIKNDLNLSEGVKKEHTDTSYTCDNCGKQFKTLRKLKLHRHKVHMKESRKRQCEVCGKWLSSRQELAAHVRRRHTGEKPFKCTFCEKSFFATYELYAHKKSMHPTSFAAYQKRKVWLHENPGKDPSEHIMECHLCGSFRSTDLDDLRSHWNEIHPNITDIPLDMNDSLKVICDTCGATLSSPTVLKVHMFKEHDLEGKNCPFCSGQFQTREEALKHVSEDHINKKTFPSKEKNVMCQHCGLVNTKDYIKRHMPIHSESIVRPKSCTYCQKVFPNYHNMTKHRRIAHTEQWKIDRQRLMVQEGSRKEYKKNSQKVTCAICGTTLSSRQQLNLHMKARHGTGLPGYKSGYGHTPNN